MLYCNVVYSFMLSSIVNPYGLGYHYGLLEIHNYAKLWFLSFQNKIITQGDIVELWVNIFTYHNLFLPSLPFLLPFPFFVENFKLLFYLFIYFYSQDKKIEKLQWN